MSKPKLHILVHGPRGCGKTRIITEIQRLHPELEIVPYESSSNVGLLRATTVMLSNAVDGVQENVTVKGEP